MISQALISHLEVSHAPIASDSHFTSTTHVMQSGVLQIMLQVLLYCIYLLPCGSKKNDLKNHLIHITEQVPCEQGKIKQWDGFKDEKGNMLMLLCTTPSVNKIGVIIFISSAGASQHIMSL